MGFTLPLQKCLVTSASVWQKMLCNLPIGTCTTSPGFLQCLSNMNPRIFPRLCANHRFDYMALLFNKDLVSKKLEVAISPMISRMWACLLEYFFYPFPRRLTVHYVSIREHTHFKYLILFKSFAVLHKKADYFLFSMCIFSLL